MPSKVRTEPLRAKDFAKLGDACGNWTDRGAREGMGKGSSHSGRGPWAWGGGFVDCTIQMALIFISMDTITQSALATGGDCHKDNNNKACSSSGSCIRRQAGSSWSRRLRRIQWPHSLSEASQQQLIFFLLSLSLSLSLCVCACQRNC